MINNKNINFITSIELHVSLSISGSLVLKLIENVHICLGSNSSSRLF